MKLQIKTREEKQAGTWEVTGFYWFGCRCSKKPFETVVKSDTLPSLKEVKEAVRAIL